MVPSLVSPPSTNLRRRRALLPLTIGLTSAAGLVVLGFLFRPQDPSETLALPLSGGGVTVSRVQPDSDATGPAVQATAGDWLLETRGLRLVLGSDAAGTERQLRHGNLTELVTERLADDVLFGLGPAVDIQGVRQELTPRRVAPAMRGDRPVLVTTHDNADRTVSLETTFDALPQKGAVEVTTRVRNTSRSLLRAVAVGDSVSWPGAPTFAPRLGFVEGPTRARVPWIARRGRELSVAVAYPDGADTDFRFDLIGPTEQRALTAALDLAPGAYHDVRRRLLVARGGLAAVAALAWQATGKPTRTVRGTLKPAPAWATVEARHPDGRPVLSVRAEAGGRFDLPLPAGDYTLVLKAPGGEDATNVRVEPGEQPIATRLIAPEPGTLRYTVTDSTGRPLSARWIVTGVPPTKTPSLGPAERAEGAGNIGYTLAGEGRIQLPPGQYRLVFTHGPEFGLWESVVTVGPELGATVRAELYRVVDTPGWISADFHVHAAPSHDSTISLEDRVVSLVAEGVEIAVPTDHNHVTDYAPLVATLGTSERLATFSGLEVTTTEWGHFNAFPYPVGTPLPLLANIAPQDLFAEIRTLSPGAVLQVNHPRMGDIGYFNRGGLEPATAQASAEGFSFDFDAIEVLNGFELGKDEVVEKNLLEWIALLRAGRRYTALGNSDSHRLSREWVGYPRNYLRVADDRAGRVSSEEIVSALRFGRVLVTNGPFIEARAGGAGPGDVAVTEDDAINVQVSVRAPAWVDITRAEIWVNGERAAVTQVPPPRANLVRLAWQTQVPIAGDSWIIVVVRGDRPLDVVLPGLGAKPIAFTNPIWIDRGGDGFAEGTLAPPAREASADAADAAP